MSQFKVGGRFVFGFVTAAVCAGSLLACGGADGSGVSSDNAQAGEVADDVSGEVLESSSDAPELGVNQEGLSFFDFFSFSSSCSDPKGTNSVLAAIATSTAIELKRWQPLTDFTLSGGVLKLTAAGKAQCSDGKCWNTQALLDLQVAPRPVQIRPGVTLDPAALRKALSSAGLVQVVNMISWVVAAHRFELVSTAPGGCDTYYWFKATKPNGSALSSLDLNSLQTKLSWVEGSSNPYIKFQVNGPMVGIDPTYGLTEAGTSSAGACTAACAKVSSTNIAGQCCSCNGTKGYVRSAWSANTYLCGG